MNVRPELVFPLILSLSKEGRAGQGLELLGGLLPQLQPLDVGGGLVVQFLAAGLNGEVFLGLCNFRLARVAVLGDEIAGEAG